MKIKDLVDTFAYSAEMIADIYALTARIKHQPLEYSRALLNKSVGLIFQKPSNRTRVSFEVGIHQLGGYSIYLGPDDIKLGKREAAKDVGKVLSRYLDGIIARTFSHKDVQALAAFATIPVINGLSDIYHPCQALADLFTIYEKFKKLRGINLAYIGDGNNVLNSLLDVCAKMGVNLNVATPVGYEPDKYLFQKAVKLGRKNKTRVSLSHDPKKSVAHADVVYTDVWTSMGQEKEYAKRLKDFQGFQINKKLLSYAGKNCLVMHCLPAHRGEEISDEVMDSKNSLVYDQAENRLHVEKAVLLKLMGAKQ